MITGDNALTGVHIARSCGMIPPKSCVYLADLSENGSKLYWENVDTSERMFEIDNDMLNPNLELAITNRAFDYLMANGTINAYLPSKSTNLQNSSH